MRKLIDFINDDGVEFGKVYFLNDFDCNKLRSYIKFYDKDSFYIGCVSLKSGKEEEMDYLQFDALNGTHKSFEVLTSKTWKGFKTYMSSKVGVEVDNKYKFF